MKGKLPKKKIQIKAELEEDPRSHDQILEEEESADVPFIPKMLKKEALYITFTGTLKSGNLPENDSLTAFCSIIHGSSWTKISGQKSFISQIASSNGDQISWNLPFEVSFETTCLTGWPQFIIAMYGTDFLGRSFVKGYGNMHLPSQTGLTKRKIQIFRPLPQSTISGIFGFFGGVQAEYKDYEKILSLGDGREVTRVKTMGDIELQIQTIKHNFKEYGYE